MEHLAVVAIVLAVATFVTGVLLPLTTRSRSPESRDERDETLAAEAAVWN